MSVRVVARIRPLLKTEIEKDVILEIPAESGSSNAKTTTLKIPNPKCQSEKYSFQFNSVYGQDATQADLFDNEVAPHVKQLFKGDDLTLFAYGVTGTGKTHTMRGGKLLAERGVIPRLLSSIYRKARKLEKDSGGNTQIEVVMSYYEIYTDKVFDLFEPLEKRTPAGLPIRDNNGKSVVVGLTERPCTSLKEFEQLYDEANVNRSTSATKLNAHSSRSHAILCVKLVQTTGNERRVSTASAIDLAGSEDNRRTDNNKDRLVESASINKSLFVLAQCVEAISKKQARIPYRESKMTRILSLGQKEGITVMILNLAPVRSYHLDTLSSLNFANRTKKIEVREIENEPFFQEQPAKGKLDGKDGSSMEAASLHRQPLRPKLLSQSSHLKDAVANTARPIRQFAVFADKTRPSAKPPAVANTSYPRSSEVLRRSPKRTSSEALSSLGRPMKFSRPNPFSRTTHPSTEGLTKDAVEALIERKVSEALAERVDSTSVSNGDPISDEVQKRLEALEKRVEGQESERAEGLQYLLMAKQHQIRGEDASALRMYQLALPHFPNNDKLERKVARLQEKLAAKKLESGQPVQDQSQRPETIESVQCVTTKRRSRDDDEDESYHEAQDDVVEDDDEFMYRPRTKIRRPQNPRLSRPAESSSVVKHTSGAGILHPTSIHEDSEDELITSTVCPTPRTKHLLRIINTKDVSQIKLLKGVGAKRAVGIVNCLCDLEEDSIMTSLGQLGRLRGVGAKTVENMRNGVVV